MSLFGYFADDEATIEAIPFCRSLICLAAATNDVKLRLFIVNDLLPCLIRRLDNQLQCAIQRLIHKLSSSASDSASRGLVILCRELYGYLLKQACHQYLFLNLIFVLKVTIGHVLHTSHAVLPPSTNHPTSESGRDWKKC